MRRGVVIVVLAPLVCAGCRVDARTTIHLDKDGGGSVTVRVRLDPEAVKLVEKGGGKLEQRILLGDLRKSGWKISSWSRDPDGSATLRLSHLFDNGAELAQIMDQLSGRDGIVQDVHVTRTRNVLQERDGVTLVANLSG